jgi:predicted ribosomally synthesized peptide with SipW-like signal peptide
MVNRQIAISTLSIISALLLTGGATFAFFSDSASSTGNTFTSGTLDLKLDDEDEITPGNSVSGSLSIANFAPGASTSGFISLHNSGSIKIEKIKMTANATVNQNPDNFGDIRDVLNLDVILDDETPDPSCTGGTSLTSAIDSEVGNGSAPLTLTEFNDGTDNEFDAILEGSEFLAAGETRNVCFTVTFASSAGNIYQGDSANVTFGFTALQDESQI